MKILLDTCVWGGGREALKAADHDVVWAGTWDIAPGDDDLLAHASREGHVLVTVDKDFGELAIVLGQPHAGIVRLVDWSAHQQVSICPIVTAEPDRVRVRPADGPPESR